MPSEFSNCKFFVYGTLKRNECREHQWPHPAIRVEVAKTEGRLFDLGPYPALVPGSETVVGELWEVAADHLAVTLETLDAIEGYRAGWSNNLYDRRTVECVTEDGVRHTASAYFYAQPLPDDEKWVLPDDRGQVVWRGGSS